MWNPMAANTQGKEGEEMIFDIMRESSIVEINDLAESASVALDQILTYRWIYSFFGTRERVIFYLCLHAPQG